MADQFLLRKFPWRSFAVATGAKNNVTAAFCDQQYYRATATPVTTNRENSNEERKSNEWFTLPAFTPTVDGSSVGKELAGRPSNTKDGNVATTMTALKWIIKCCPQLPRSLVHKLFRLRQVRKECSDVETNARQVRRIGAKELMNNGDRVFLPTTIEVHRLDRDSSGILVMGRTQLSATILHSIFREKTFGAADDVLESKRTLQKHYWALVIGSPRRAEGIISVPLGKVVVGDGKSERITIVDNVHASAQYAVTEYRVISSSTLGYTWLKLSPLTGRKHQLRVHCAEVLGTPIVGDYKYGWQAHKKLKHILISNSDSKPDKKTCNGQPDPFGLNLGSGSISDKHTRLHLHCKQMVLPNVAQALRRGNVNLDFDPRNVESIRLDAPLPSHMQRSWDLLN